VLSPDRLLFKIADAGCFYRRNSFIFELWSIVIVKPLSKTTVEVKKTTLQALEELRSELGVKSLDEAIKVLIRRVRNVPESRFGAHPEMKSFTCKDEASAHEL